MVAEQVDDSEDPPRPEIILARINFLAEHSECVLITGHAEQRMEERDISSVMMYRILRSGWISGDVKPGKRKGNG